MYNLDDDVTAYVLNFDKGYLVVDMGMQIVEMSTSEKFEFSKPNEKRYLVGTGYYFKEDGQLIPNTSSTPTWGSVPGRGLVISNIYHDLTSTEMNNYDNFEITISLANDLQDKNGDYGEYTIYTRDQGSTTDCGPQAGVNWMYTFDFSNVTSIAKSNNSDDELDDMRLEMDWTTAGQDYLVLVFVGTWPADFMNGFEDYTDDDYIVLSEDAYLHHAPAVGLYYNLNVEDTAHYAMIIGQAQADNWWIFKHNFDIISTWDENYNHTYSGKITTKITGSTPSYHFVKSSYRQSTYVLYERLYPKWYEVWKPNKELVRK